MRIYHFMHTWRAHTHTHVHLGLRDCELRGVRAYEGSSNEKPHYFLMHLLIDQSRKGSAPPTLWPPLPSVNHSRNNLMIGAPVLLSRLPRRFPSTIRVGDYYDVALGKSFSSSHAPLPPFILSEYDYVWTMKKTGTCVRYTEQRRERRARLLRTQEYSLISPSSEYVYFWIRGTTCVHTIAREARL